MLPQQYHLLHLTKFTCLYSIELQTAWEGVGIIECLFTLNQVSLRYYGEILLLRLKHANLESIFS